MSEIKLIAGLGNPGSQYVDTRHNAGFRVIQLLSERLGIEVKQKKFGGLFGEGFLDDRKIMLLKPQQYMNRSGQVVATALGFYKLTLDQLLVITDDLALAPGLIRIRARGSSGGQKGLADIINKLGSDNFTRIRVGIGSNENIAAQDYVLGKPTPRQMPLIEQAVDNAARAAETWIKYGPQTAMNEYNVRQKPQNENNTNQNDNDLEV